MDVTVFGCDPDEAGLFRARAPYLGITPVITAAPVSAGNARLAGGSRCVSVSHTAPLDEARLEGLHEVGVRYVSTRSIGLDHIDLDVAARLGIRVENVLYSPDSVADHTLMLMLMGLRNARQALRRLEEHDYRLGTERGRELRDLTVGVVGTGRIGSAVVDRLRGFGSRVLAHGRGDARPDDRSALHGLLAESDIVTLHVPLDEGTRHLIDRDAFARMRPGALLVNTGRGGLVDTAALVESLESGRLAGAALDVLEGEEHIFSRDGRGVPPEHELLRRLHRHPHVVITPHSGYFTRRVLAETVVNSLINCLRFERGLQYD